MPFKPVGVDENSNFPTRVVTRLSSLFLPKPSGGNEGNALAKQSDGSYAPVDLATSTSFKNNYATLTTDTDGTPLLVIGTL